MGQRSVDEIKQVLGVKEAKEIRVGPLAPSGWSTAPRQATEAVASRIGQWWAASVIADIAVAPEEASALIAAGAEQVDSMQPFQSPGE